MLPFLFSCIEYDLQEKGNDTVEPTHEDSAIVEEVPPLDCQPQLREIAEIEQNLECTSEEYNIENPWNVEIEWQWQGLIDEPNINQVMVAPIVGNQ